MLTDSPVTVTGTVNEVATSVMVTVNTISGVFPATIINGTFTASVPLAGGGNYVSVRATGAWYVTPKTVSVHVVSATGSMTGKVVDSLSGLPLQGATVTATDARAVTQSVTTDAAGQYSLYNIADGILSGSIARAGYGTYSFTTTVSTGQQLTFNGSVDPILPLISSITATPSTVSSAVVAWITDQQGTTVVEYGESTAYGATVSDAALTSTHSATLILLKAGTSYHFRVSSVNSYGVTATSGDYTFTTPVFTAKTVGDSGNVTVMEVTGNYDGKKGDGTVNDLPRQEVAKEYFRTHPDSVDFLVILSNFDYALPESEAKGFYLGVKNDTQGIGQALFDNSPSFGSAGKLYGTIDLGNVTALTANPYGPKLDETITTLNHELMHRFGSYVRFKNSDGTVSDALLGRDAGHWSYLLDTQGSVMYGNGWRDNGDGTFTSTAMQSGFSPLDLYLMGMVGKEQVPPMLLIENPAIDKTQMSHLGDTVTGTALTVTIDEIIAAEGARMPDAATSRKKFNVAFVLLTNQGENAGVAPAAVETLRSAWAGRFAELTLGAGGIDGVTPALIVTVDSPTNSATVTGPDVTVTGTVINSTGAETGIVVNGVPVTVSGNRFNVNHLPLQQGSNSISVTGTDTGGRKATTSVTVTAAPGNYIRLIPSVESGVAPLELTLTLDGSFGISNPSFSFTGPVALQLEAGQTPNFTAKLAIEGTYAITATATGPNGQSYSDTITVSVISKTLLDRLLTAKWEAMKAFMSVLDVEKAAGFFSDQSKERYFGIFTALGDTLPQVAHQMQGIRMIYAREGVAKYRIRRAEASGEMTYYIYFGKDENNGLWKLQQF